MNYVYNVHLNFNEQLFDFYEWTKKDKIFLIKKIPIFRVKEDDLKNILNYKIEFSNSFYEKVFDKCERYKNKKIKYAFLLTDNNKVIGINYYKRKIFISDILIEEENKIIKMSYLLPYTNIEYKKIYKKQASFLTRKKTKEKEMIFLKINNLKKYENYEKLKYIYYEYFNKKETNVELMINTFKKEIENNFISAYEILKNIIKNV